MTCKNPLFFGLILSLTLSATTALAAPRKEKKPKATPAAQQSMDERERAEHALNRLTFGRAPAKSSACSAWAWNSGLPSRCAGED